MEIERELESIGLSKKEAQVYFKLIEAGPSSAIKISKLTGISRWTVYDALDSLVVKGLTNYQIVDKKKVFQSTGVDSLYALIDEKRKVVSSVGEKLREILDKKEEQPVVEIFSGITSIKGVFERQLKTKKIYYIYGGYMPAREFLKIYYPQWTKKRVHAGIKIKAIFVDDPEVRKYV
ncbi:MAG: helix-turn-helix domain-containing protein, partial [Candidatus Diapherotrites archaeon]